MDHTGTNTDKRLLLLGLLRRHQMHGYELATFIEGPMSACTDLKKATAYFLLDKLEHEAYITSHTEREGNRPARKVYEITPSGESAFQRLLRDSLGSFDLPPFMGDVALAFLDALTPAEIDSLLRRRRAAVEGALAEAERAPEHAGSTQLLLDHQVHYLRSELAWVNTVISRIGVGADRLPDAAGQSSETLNTGDQ